MTGDLRPKALATALVTGASRRLGRAIALHLARLGLDVALHHRSDRDGAAAAARDVSHLGRRAVTLQADLADAPSCDRLIAQAEEALGGLDLLVNNAAVFERQSLPAMSADAFDRHMTANARSVYCLCLAAGRRMRERHAKDPSFQGAIVNLSDVAASRPWAGYVAYSASKAAVSNLTLGFARLLGAAARVNAVAPGPILPPPGREATPEDRAVQATLLKRWGDPSDIAAAVAFLARAQYVTGVVLHVDGGRSIA